MVNMSKSTKIGVIGVGHLGYHHTKHYAQLKGADLVGIYDSNQKAAKETARRFNTKPFKSMASMVH